MKKLVRYWHENRLLVASPDYMMEKWPWFDMMFALIRSKLLLWAVHLASTLQRDRSIALLGSRSSCPINHRSQKFLSQNWHPPIESSSRSASLFGRHSSDFPVFEGILTLPTVTEMDLHHHVSILSFAKFEGRDRLHLAHRERESHSKGLKLVT